ncbi:flagellar assembly factor FliW [Marinitoga hydrogenitolerans DSM 16785]|uniref:Flagellar assembly factor FliW n=1 Tax=Marinitoga hydrogenitolerans (strain DSM 16785 / JCM 12826 / AT1271) TaxID=1122195 RepID=A0A1M4V383_MARH1|nr:flagellar assembly protein FliW [Marinitoga hydrogenitolerans]SHE63348.1 flagellar assembly factor FliW [Marinitoga hydrogenitolerans DSM 16785]
MALRLYKTRIGEIEVEDKEIIIFEDGIPGFEHLKRFVILTLEETYPIMWLLSLEDELVSLPIIEPKLIRVDYQIKVPEEIVSKLGINDDNDAAVFTILTIPHENPENATVNLKAPLIISKKTNKGIQYILDDESLSIKHNIRDEIIISQQVLERQIKQVSKISQNKSKYNTKFGELEIADNEIIIFESGIPGFENLKKFYIHFSKETFPIQWLLSLENPEITFPVIDPVLVRVDYTFDLSKDIVEYLEIKKPEDVKIFTIMTIPHGDPDNITVNLKAPIIISKVNNKGVQLILENENYHLKHNVKEEISRSDEIIKKQAPDKERGA